MTAFTQTDTTPASPFDTTQAECSGATAGTTSFVKEASEGGTAGVTGITPKLTNPNTGRILLTWVVDPDDTYDWEAGTATIRIRTSTGNANLTWTETWLCRVNSSGTNQATYGSLTGQSTSMTGASTKTHSVTGLSAQSADNGDRCVVICVFDGPGGHGNETMVVEPDQDLDIPINAGDVLKTDSDTATLAEGTDTADNGIAVDGPTTTDTATLDEAVDSADNGIAIDGPTTADTGTLADGLEGTQTATLTAGDTGGLEEQTTRTTITGNQDGGTLAEAATLDEGGVSKEGSDTGTLAESVDGIALSGPGDASTTAEEVTGSAAGTDGDIGTADDQNNGIMVDGPTTADTGTLAEEVTGSAAGTDGDIGTADDQNNGIALDGLSDSGTLAEAATLDTGGVTKSGDDSATLAEGVTLTATVVAGDSAVLASVLTLSGIYTASDAGTLADTGVVTVVAASAFTGEAIGLVTITARPGNSSVAIEI